MDRILFFINVPFAAVPLGQDVYPVTDRYLSGVFEHIYAEHVDERDFVRQQQPNASRSHFPFLTGAARICIVA